MSSHLREQPTQFLAARFELTFGLFDLRDGLRDLLIPTLQFVGLRRS